MNLKEKLGETFYFKRMVSNVEWVLPRDLVQKVNLKEPQALTEAQEWVSKYGLIILFARGLIRGDEYVYFEDGNVFVNTINLPSLGEVHQIARLYGENHLVAVKKIRGLKKKIFYLKNLHCII